MLNKKTLNDFVKEDELRELIGPHADYYIGKWRILFRKTNRIKSVKHGFSFNLSASFFPGVWFIYRGMFLEGLLVLSFLSFFNFLTEFSIGIPNLLGWFCYIGLIFYVSFKANSHYFNFLAKKIRKNNLKKAPQKKNLKTTYLKESIFFGVLYAFITFIPGFMMLDSMSAHYDETYKFLQDEYFLGL